MKPRSLLGRHLDARDALDYLEHHLDAKRARAVEEHLAAPCPACRERLRALGSLLARMRDDRSPAVPGELRARAFAAFIPHVEPASAHPLVEAIARLVFDSWVQPLPAPVRRAVGEARRLRFALAGGTLELEIEPEADGAVAVRGRLDAAEPALQRIEARVRGERFMTWPDTGGAFAFERLPAGDLDLAVIGPERLDRIPRIQP